MAKWQEIDGNWYVSKQGYDTISDWNTLGGGGCTSANLGSKDFPFRTFDILQTTTEPTVNPASGDKIVVGSGKWTDDSKLATISRVFNYKGDGEVIIFNNGDDNCFIAYSDLLVPTIDGFIFLGNGHAIAAYGLGAFDNVNIIFKNCIFINSKFRIAHGTKRPYWYFENCLMNRVLWNNSVKFYWYLSLTSCTIYKNTSRSFYIVFIQNLFYSPFIKAIL